MRRTRDDVNYYAKEKTRMAWKAEREKEEKERMANTFADGAANSMDSVSGGRARAGAQREKERMRMRANVLNDPHEHSILALLHVRSDWLPLVGVAYCGASFRDRRAEFRCCSCFELERIA